MSGQTESKIAKEFRDGIDSVKNRRRDPAGSRRTEKQSYWFADTCPECRHTFREGDLVQIAPDGIVRHQDPVLGCPIETKPSGTPSNTGIVFEFLCGALSLWPTVERQYMLALDENHPLSKSLVAMPAHHFRRPRCVVCGNTLRAGEIVLICPCAAHEHRPPRCQIAVHHDPLHGIYCYGDWHPEQYNLRCPATLRKIAV